MTNPHAGVGAGRARKTWRIKEWLDMNGFTFMDVAQRAGLRSHSTVSRTIRGTGNNVRVLRALQEMGCPEAYLSLPQRMQNEAA